MKYIIKDLHKDSPSYHKRDAIIGKQAREIGVMGSFEGYNSCTYTSNLGYSCFLANAVLEEEK